jgi:hypothetical protein
MQAGGHLPGEVRYRSYEPRGERMNTASEGAHVAVVPKKAEGNP